MGKIRKKGPLPDRKWVQAFRADARTAQNNLCCYCTEPLTSVTVSADHLVPRSGGGTTKRENISASCAPCNRAKGSMTVRVFNALLRSVDCPVDKGPRVRRRILASVGVYE